MIEGIVAIAVFGALVWLFAPPMPPEEQRSTQSPSPSLRVPPSKEGRAAMDWFATVLSIAQESGVTKVPILTSGMVAIQSQSAIGLVDRMLSTTGSLLKSVPVLAPLGPAIGLLLESFANIEKEKQIDAQRTALAIAMHRIIGQVGAPPTSVLVWLEYCDAPRLDLGASETWWLRVWKGAYIAALTYPDYKPQVYKAPPVDSLNNTGVNVVLNGRLGDLKPPSRIGAWLAASIDTEALFSRCVFPTGIAEWRFPRFFYNVIKSQSPRTDGFCFTREMFIETVRATLQDRQDVLASWIVDKRGGIMRFEVGQDVSGRYADLFDITDLLPMAGRGSVSINKANYTATITLPLDTFITWLVTGF